MKKKLIKCVTSFFVIVMFCIAVYASVILFISVSENSNFTKKRIFEFNLTSGLNTAEIGPSDSCAINPYIYNSSTEQMHVFIKFNTPSCDGDFFCILLNQMKIRHLLRKTKKDWFMLMEMKNLQN